MLTSKHVTGRSPVSVDVVALGVSLRSYVAYQLRKDTDEGLRDEVWAVNRGLRVIRADLAFVLDDLRGEAARDPDYGAAMQVYDRPIITTTPYIEYPTAVRYPAREIMDTLHEASPTYGPDPYWHNSLPMVVAYAWYIGVERLTLWGADYTDDLGRTLEADRANLEYWCAIARYCGMKISVPDTSSLFNANLTKGRLRIYGLRHDIAPNDWMWAREAVT